MLCDDVFVYIWILEIRDEPNRKKPRKCPQNAIFTKNTETLVSFLYTFLTVRPKYWPICTGLKS